jgi:tetratricopeptide (TPR) repeat protein
VNRWTRSRVYSRKGEYDLAIADLDRLIAVDLAVNRIDYTSMAPLVLQLQWCADATANDQRSTDVDRSLPCLLVDRGDVYNRKCDDDRAIADYDLALKLHPEMTIGERAEAARAAQKEPTM